MLSCAAQVVGCDAISLEDLERITSLALEQSGYCTVGRDDPVAMRILSMDLADAGAWAFLADPLAAEAIRHRLHDSHGTRARLYSVRVLAEVGRGFLKARFVVDGPRAPSLGSDSGLRTELDGAVPPSEIMESLVVEAFTRVRRVVLESVTIVAERESRWVRAAAEVLREGSVRAEVALSARVRALRVQYLRSLDCRIDQIGGGRVRLRLLLPDGANVVSVLDADELAAVIKESS